VVHEQGQHLRFQAINPTQQQQKTGAKKIKAMAHPANLSASGPNIGAKPSSPV